MTATEPVAPCYDCGTLDGDRMLPGWDSIDGTAEWQRFFAIASVATLGLLAGLEALVHYLHERKQLIRRLEIGVVWVFLALAFCDVLTLVYDIHRDNLEAPRHINRVQREILVARLNQGRGSSIWISSMIDSTETKAFARELGNLFQEAGWKVSYSQETRYSPIGVFLPLKPAGQKCRVDPGTPEAIAGQALVDAKVGDFVCNQNIPSEEVVSIVVGHSPNSPAARAMASHNEE